MTLFGLLLMLGEEVRQASATHDGHNHDHGGHSDDDGHDHGDDAAEHADDEHDEWGMVIGASAATCVPAVLGIAALPPLRYLYGGSWFEGELPKWVPAFAAGVIFAAALFLLLPEALLLIQAEQDEEVDTSWKWGTSVLCGWFFGLLSHYVMQVGEALLKRGGSSEDIASAEENVEKDKTSAPAAAPKGIDWPVAVPVLIGDLMHNLVDGMSIGISAKLCSSSFTWTLVWASIAHEAPQEIADFGILTGKARMVWWLAIVLNFLSSCSAIVGAAIAYKADVSSVVQGAMLAFGAGVYAFVALTELGGDMLHLRGKAVLFDATTSILAFAVGSVAIGLVLLDHEHCAAGHEGHNH